MGITSGFEVPQYSETVILGSGEHAEGLQQCLHETPRQETCPMQAPAHYLPLRAASVRASSTQPSCLSTAAQGSVRITTHLHPERAKSETGTTPQPLHKATTFSCHKQKKKKKEDLKGRTHCFWSPQAGLCRARVQLRSSPDRQRAGLLLAQLQPSPPRSGLRQLGTNLS